MPETMLLILTYKYQWIRDSWKGWAAGDDGALWRVDDA